ncbi:MAG: amidohydrolase family protein, partial [Thermoleophilia bacterium]
MEEPRTLTLPGFVNAHCHAFQRGLRGRRTGGDFWAWREAMIAEAERQTPETVRREYAETYGELRSAGYTAVGEFHYLGLPEAHAAVEAAREA